MLHLGIAIALALPKRGTKVHNRLSTDETEAGEGTDMISCRAEPAQRRLQLEVAVLRLVALHALHLHLCLCLSASVFESVTWSR